MHSEALSRVQWHRLLNIGFVSELSVPTLINTIPSHATTQDEPLAAAIGAREQALAEATTATFEIASGLLSYARTHLQPDLVVQARVSARMFCATRRAERMLLAQRVLEFVQPLVADRADYRVTAAKLTEFKALIAAADQVVDERASASAAKKVATAEVERLCAETEALLAQIDPLLVQLGRVDPEAYAEYRAARDVFNRRGARRNTAETGATTTPAAAPEASAERNPRKRRPREIKRRPQGRRFFAGARTSSVAINRRSGRGRRRSQPQGKRN